MRGDQAGLNRRQQDHNLSCCRLHHDHHACGVECAIGVEPIRSTLCRREPWPLGYAHMEKKLPGMDSNHHVACFRGRWATSCPTRQRKVGEGGFEPPTARFQTAHADLTALLAGEVVALATRTARASPRKRDEASSESKHDDRSPRTSHNPHTRTAVGESTTTSFLSVTGV